MSLGGNSHQRTELLVDVELVSVEQPTVTSSSSSLLAPAVQIVSPSEGQSINHPGRTHHSNGAVKSYQSTAPTAHTKVRTASSTSDDSVLPEIGYSTSSQSNTQP